MHYNPVLDPKLRTRFNAEADAMQPGQYGTPIRPEDTYLPGKGPRMAAPEQSGANKKPVADADVDTPTRKKMSPREVEQEPLKAHIDDLLASPAGQAKLYKMAQDGLAEAKPKVMEVIGEFEGADGGALLKKNGQAEFIAAVKEKNTRPGKGYNNVGRMGDMVRGRVNLVDGQDMNAAIAAVKKRFPNSKVDAFEDGPYPRYHVDIELENGVKFELQVGTYATTKFLEQQMVPIPRGLRSKVGLADADYHVVKYDILDKIKDPAIRAKYGLDQLDADYDAALKATGTGKFDSETTSNISQRLGDALQRLDQDNPDFLKSLYTKAAHEPKTDQMRPLPDPHADPRQFRKEWAATQQRPKTLPENPDLYFTNPKGSTEIDLSQLQPIRRREQGVARGAIYMDGARREVLPKRKPITVSQVGTDDNGRPIYKINDGNSTFAIAQEYGWSRLRVTVVDDPDVVKGGARGGPPPRSKKGPRMAAPEQEDVGGMPMPTRQKTDVDVEPAAAKKSTLKVEDEPDAKTVHDGKDHDPKYVDMKKKPVFDGEPKMEDVQQGYIADCNLIASMAAVAKQRPDVIKNMFKDLGDGTVEVTLHTTPAGKIVAPGAAGAQSHTYRVTKDLPSVNGKTPTYAKGKDNGMLWPALLEKAYAIHKKNGKYQGLNKGGQPAEAMEVITGKKAQSYQSTSKTDDALITGIDTALKNKKPVTATSMSKDALKNDAALKTLADDKQVFPWHVYTVEGVEDGKIKLYNPWGRRHPKPLTPAEYKKLFPWTAQGDAPPQVVKANNEATGGGDRPRMAAPENVAKQPLKASLTDLLASPEGQAKLYKMAQAGLSEARPKLEAIARQFEGATAGALLKKNGQDAFTASVKEKVERKNYPNVGAMGDMVRGRISLQNGADLDATLKAVKAHFPNADFDIKDGPYPRVHVDVVLENGIKFELQVGTKATTHFLEKTMVAIPSALQTRVGLAEADFHVAKYDILDKVKDPGLRAKYGLDDFDKRYNQALKTTGTGEIDIDGNRALAADLGGILKRMESDDPEYLNGLYTKDTHAPAEPKKAAPVQDGAGGMPEKTLRLDQDHDTPKKPHVDVSENPNPVWKREDGDHEPSYKDVGEEVFKGNPKLEDVQQGYLGDCYLVAAMGAVVEARPDIIRNMFQDNGDGTVTVTLHTLKGGYLVPAGSKGATEHHIRVKKDLPVKKGGGKTPTYAKGKDGQIWPGLLEKAYAVLKGNGEYDKIGHGGFTTEAMQTITGKRSRSFSSSSKNNKKLLKELSGAINGEKPLAAGSPSKSLVKNNAQLKKLMEDKDVVANHAYIVKEVKDGLIHMHNPWGKRHPKPLTPDEFKKLYPNVYVGDAPPKKGDIPDTEPKQMERMPAPEQELDAGAGGAKVAKKAVSAYVDDASPLHRNVSNRERYEVIKDVPLSEVVSAPGHEFLRSPQAVEGIAKDLKASGDAGRKMFEGKEPMLLNVYTKDEGGKVVVTGVEVLDGNHRFAGGLHSGVWKTIGDIPAEMLSIRVNGFDTHGNQAPRWIPKHIAEASAIGWHEVTGPLTRGPTAQIGGDVSSLDPRFPEKYRGVAMGQVVETSLARNKKKKPHEH